MTENLNSNFAAIFNWNHFHVFKNIFSDVLALSSHFLPLLAIYKFFELYQVCTFCGVFFIILLINNMHSEEMYYYHTFLFLIWLAKGPIRLFLSWIANVPGRYHVTFYAFCSLRRCVRGYYVGRVSSCSGLPWVLLPMFS